MAESALEGIRVLDMSDGIAGAYCTRLLAGFGAEVVKVERPGEGDATRRVGPFPKDVPHPERSALFLNLNLSKKGVTLNLETVDGRKMLRQLVEKVDVLVEGFKPGQMAEWGLDYSSLEKTNPGLIMASITPFGQTGPYRDYRWSSAVLDAMGGHTYIQGDPGREPLRYPEGTAEYSAGMLAVAAIMGALFHSADTGEGQFIDLSIMECLAGLDYYRTARWTHLGVVQERRGGRYSIWPGRVYPCRDGYVGLAGVGPTGTLFPMHSVMGIPELLDPKYQTAAQREALVEELDDIVQPWLMEHDRYEIFNALQQVRVQAGVCNSAEDLLSDPGYEARGFWEEIDHPEAGRLTYPGAPLLMSESAWQASRAPLLGEHNVEICQGDPGHSVAEPARLSGDGVIQEVRNPEVQGDSSRQRLPLAGVRVIALEFMWAGPLNTQMLADLGAEVIKVEHHMARGTAVSAAAGASTYVCFGDGDPGERPWNRSGITNQFARGKLSVVLDMNHPKGKELFLRLVAISDVVQDNYSRRVMPNFGLDYPALREVNPRIIMVRQSGFGAVGPYQDYIAGGCPTGIHGGMPFYMGYHDGEPMRPESCIVDPWAGIVACSAVLAALWQRRRTGKGQYIDSGQAESVTSALGDRVLGYQMKSNWPPRVGNRHYSMAPHGCYPCRGENKWIAIAVGSDEEWATLCQAMSDPLWAREKRFGDPADRYENQDELDRQIGEWTARHDHIELMHLLQSHGVTAGAVLNQAELMSDPHLKERDYYLEMQHPETGVRRYPRQPWKMSRMPQREVRAPLLGEHNRYVLGELLGLSEGEIAQLEEERVISDRPLA